MAERYHHGDLPNALRHSAAEVIAEQGLGNFSLREVARRAGVSHAAPAHHFGDMRGLLTSLAIEGFDTLRDVTTVASSMHDDPVERLVAMGEAYVSLAASHPAHCQVMFRPDVVDVDDPRLSEAGLASYAVLHDAMAAVIEDVGSGVDVDLAVELCWATMQGLVVLQQKLDVIDALGGRPSVPTTERVRRLTLLMLDGIRD